MSGSSFIDCTTEQMLEHRFPRYEELPSFGIYMDQLIPYINDTVGFYYQSDEKLLTASMVNNYVKYGVIPKAEKKKYTRDHIAHLIAVCLLKKVYSIQEITDLIQIQMRTFPTPHAYDSFITALELNIAMVFLDERIKDNKQGKPPQIDFSLPISEQALLMEKVLSAFSNKLFAQKIIFRVNQSKK